MEVVKFQQAQLINFDLDMYYARTDTPALCRTSSLVEELGQIEYVFSDKTGTLTCNEMEFRCCSIAGYAYADVVDENRRGDGEDAKDGWRTFAEMRSVLEKGSNNPFVDGGGVGREIEVLREFLTLLAVCHTVIPEIKDEKTIYQASSPDEAALVAGAELLGYQFQVFSNGTGTILYLKLLSQVRKPKSVFVNIQGMPREFQILNICEFNSTRKRMSTIIRTPEGKIKLYCKGADTVILDRLAKNQLYTEKTLLHLEVRFVSCFSSQVSVQTAHRCRRTTRRTDFGRCAWRSEIYRKQSTSSGRLFMTGQLLRSTAVAMRSMRQRS